MLSYPWVLFPVLIKIFLIWTLFLCSITMWHSVSWQITVYKRYFGPIFLGPRLQVTLVLFLRSLPKPFPFGLDLNPRPGVLGWSFMSKRNFWSLHSWVHRWTVTPFDLYTLIWTNDLVLFDVGYQDGIRRFNGYRTCQTRIFKKYGCLI